MNALDSPMEALAINYLSYGVLTAINNLWAWIAVFTAAVSFWKIRASGSVSDQRLTFLEPAAEYVSDPSPPSAAGDELASASETAAVSTMPAKRIKCADMLEAVFDGPTRGKFVVYYGGDNDEVFEDDERTEGDYEEVDGGERRRCVEEWASVLRMKTGQMGWYRYQDLTVLDGNVVRLWDACRRRNGYQLSGGDVTWSN